MTSTIKWAMDTVNELFSMGFREALSFKKTEKYNCYFPGLGDWESKHRKEIVSRFLFYCGASKVCIQDLEVPEWVIKMDFLKDTNPHISDIKIESHCAREAENYKKALELEMDDCFAAVIKAGEVEGRPVYVQERVIVDEEQISDFFCDYIREGYKKEEGVDEEEYWEEVVCQMQDLEDGDRVLAIFGRKEVLEFICEHSINDLHSGNWGITEDGRVVMFDYSGYWW